MAYCDATDIKQRLPEQVLARLTDDDAGATVDDALLSEMAAAASSEMDSYLAVNYPTPLEPVPEIVKHYCCWIAIYHLFSRQGVDPETAEKTVETNYRRAIKWLEGVAAKTVRLPADDPARDAGVTLVSDTRLFDRTKMGGF